MFADESKEVEKEEQALAVIGMPSRAESLDDLTHVTRISRWLCSLVTLPIYGSSWRSVGQMEKSIPVTCHESLFTTSSLRTPWELDLRVCLFSQKPTGLGDKSSQCQHTDSGNSAIIRSLHSCHENSKGSFRPIIRPHSQARDELWRSNAR